jgi:hypothetical protein
MTARTSVPPLDSSAPVVEFTYPAPVRWILSGCIVLHLLAVCAPPASLATRSGATSSPVVAPIFDGLRPYIEACYLNHGYFFFAPDPGPSHPVRYELEFADQRTPETGVFPDRQVHWPRLMYHRHFMLAESLTDRFAPPRFQPEPQRRDDSRQAARIYNRELAAWQQAKADWEAARERYVAVRDSVARHLQAVSGASEVRLVRREHRQPSPDEFELDNVRLTDDQLYLDLPEVPVAEVLPWNAPRQP